jgi:hypothetical protein
MTVMTAGELKQLVLRTYNAVNQQISGVGVRQQRVELHGEHMLVIAQHQRIPALAALDGTRRPLTRELDVAIVDRYKELLKAELEPLLGIGIRTILKDYDPQTQLACTLVVLERDPLRVEMPTD